MFVMGSKSVEDDLESSYDSANYQDYSRKEDLSNKENTTEKNAISKRKSRMSSQELRKYTLQVKGIWIIAMPKSSEVLQEALTKRLSMTPYDVFPNDHSRNFLGIWASVKTNTQEPLITLFRSSHLQNFLLYFRAVEKIWNLDKRERREGH